MKTILKLIIFPTVLYSLVSCGSANKLTRSEQYAGLYEEKPVVLAVMPPINNTAMTEAKDLLYTSISKPLIEAGYYVLSPNLLMDMLKAESAYDSELFIDGDMKMFNKILGADAIVFSVIDEWAKKSVGIQTTIRYVIKSAYTNDIIFDRRCELYLNLAVNSSSGSALGALLDLAMTAINTASTDHIVAARKCNYFIFDDIPRGKYSPDYMKDMDIKSGPKNIKASVK